MSDDAPRGNPGVDPDELDISKSEYVRELGDDRYVVSAGSGPPRAPREGERTDDADGDAAGDRDQPAQPGDFDEPLPPDRDAVPSRQGDSAPGTDVAPGGGAVDPSDRSGSSPSAETPAAGTNAAASEAAAADAAAADTAAQADASRSASSPDPNDSPADPGGPAGADDGLPGDPTRTDQQDANDRPASHVRRGAPRAASAGESASANTSAGPGASGDLDAGAVGQWLAASLADSEFAYGFDATLSLNGRTTRHRMASDDVGETFETLVTWFANAAGGDTPPEEALGILLAGMETGPRLPPNAVRSALAGLGLSRDDSVEDLLEALDRAGGLDL